MNIKDFEIYGWAPPRGMSGEEAVKSGQMDALIWFKSAASVIAEKEQTIAFLEKRIADLETVSWYEKAYGYHSVSVGEAVSDMTDTLFEVVSVDPVHKLETRWGFISGQDDNFNYIGHEFPTEEEATAAANKMKLEQDAWNCRVGENT